MFPQCKNTEEGWKWISVLGQTEITLTYRKQWEQHSITPGIFLSTNPWTESTNEETGNKLKLRVLVQNGLQSSGVKGMGGKKKQIRDYSGYTIINATHDIEWNLVLIRDTVWTTGETQMGSKEQTI